MKLDYPIRLQSYLAKSGLGSRRSCEGLITSGRVKVNNKRVTVLGTKVFENDAVMVDDSPVEPADRFYYFALNKPKGYVCTNYDPKETLYARDLIDVREKNLLFNVGRLDKDSTGLILFTNDGETANILTHPSSGIEKEYLVNADREILTEDLREMMKGVYIDQKIPYRIKSYKIESKRWVRVVLTEGKNREIRKLFAFFDYDVKKLIRVRIGSLELGDLEPGRYRAISKEEMLSVLAGKKGKK